MSESELTRQRVSITLFAEVEAVDAYDGAHIAQMMLHQAGIRAGQVVSTDLPRDLGARDVTVVGVMDTGMAMGNGYLWTAPTAKVWQQMGMQAPPLERP